MAFVDTETRPAGEVQQKVGRLKLSEAIRIGARIRPQCTGMFFKNAGSCAIGAAMEACGLPYWEEFGNRPEAVEMFPDLFLSLTKHTPLAKAITNLNDGGQSREQIADWLAAQGL